jgi:hypothetical protein
LVKNRYGTLLLDLCKGNNFFILNARLDGDKHGNYTCKNASVVDYCICIARFVNIFVTLKVLEFSKLFPDVHCPLSICLNGKTNCLANTTESSQKCTERVNTGKWDNEKLLNFQSNINQDDLNKTIVQLVRA